MSDECTARHDRLRDQWEREILVRELMPLPDRSEFLEGRIDALKTILDRYEADVDDALANAADKSDMLAFTPYDELVTDLAGLLSTVRTAIRDELVLTRRKLKRRLD